MVGPSFDNVSHASHAPIAKATNGSSQIAEKRRERRVVAWTWPGLLATSLMFRTSTAPTGQGSLMPWRRVYLSRTINYANPASLFVAYVPGRSACAAGLPNSNGGIRLLASADAIRAAVRQSRR